jgi:hypothetical protein
MKQRVIYLYIVLVLTNVRLLFASKISLMLGNSRSYLRAKLLAFAYEDHYTLHVLKTTSYC